MDRPQRELIRTSYEAIAPQLPQLVQAFYSILFQKAPQVARMFPEDMERQRAHLGAALAVIARNALSLESLERPLQEMGARHAEYGVLPQHYTLVQSVLLEALAKTAGPGWTAELHNVWEMLIKRVSASMLQGAAMAALQAAESMTKESHSRSAAVAFSSHPTHAGVLRDDKGTPSTPGLPHAASTTSPIEVKKSHPDTGENRQHI